MKTHATLKELLEDFSNVYFEKCFNDNQKHKNVINDYVSSNNLALGKPEPLAKNKQTENDFKCAKSFLLDLPKCDKKCDLCFYVSS